MHESMTDQEVLAAVAAGRRDAALAGFVDRYGARLLGACRRLAGDPAEGEDAYQDVLVRVDRGLATFRGDSGLYTWAFRVAVHVTLNRRRGLRANAEHVALRDGAATDGDPDASCASAFRTWVVERALLGLPDGQRRALTLHDLEELSAAETGALLGIATNAVKQRVHRARRTLRERIAREYASRGVPLDDFEAIGCVSGLFAAETVAPAPPPQR